MFRRKKNNYDFDCNVKFHLVGIKGTGMSALATCLLDLGYDVCGSDESEIYFTDKNLLKHNLIPLEFSENNITADKIYIISNAYDYKHLEVKKIIQNKYRYYYYHEFIEKFFKEKKIGVSGTHGKTTVSSLLTQLFTHEPIAALIGDGTGKADASYRYFIFEACEYKNHFLNYTYDYLIINNIDFDHPDFFKDINDVKKSFIKACKKAKHIIINGDDPNLKEFEHKSKYTFGFDSHNDLSVKKVQLDENGYLVNFKLENKEFTFKLPFFGKHMIYNFMASFLTFYLITASDNEDLEKSINDSLNNYSYPQVRMHEIIYNSNIIVDDYAHHPTEIKACLDALKLKYPNKKLIVVFEPHTYSRTLALAKEFNECFKNVDELYLCKTFTSKREKYNRETEMVVRQIFSQAKVYNIRVYKKILKNENSIIAFLGAGNLRKKLDDLNEK